MRVVNERFPRLRHVSRNILSILLSALLIVQPVLVEVANAQQIIIDSNGNVGSAPSLKGASGKTVVDIATPNSGGVSLNQYSSFNVTSSGVILNNSANSSTTQLAGTVQGNSKLAAGSAATIVNEVTSTNSSALRGAIEVAGSKANVIVANPNGILCDGCNFINAGTATLSTGVPVVTGGTVRLDVTKGAVTIGRNGLNGKANGVSGINLIGRSVIIDGRVTAVDSVNVLAGPQGWDLAQNKRVSTLTGDGAVAGSYAIDATAFGAMEAGRIQIIGNEAGLGVRSLGALKSTALDVTVSGPGEVSVGSVSAQTAAKLASSNGNLTLNGDVSALTGQAALTARLNLTAAEAAGIFGFGGVNISSAKGTATLSGDIQSNSAVTINGPTLSFGSYLTTSGAVTFTSTGTATLDGATIVAASVAANAISKSFVLANTAIFSAQDVQIGTVAFSLGRDVIIDGLDAATSAHLTVQASGDFHNNADLRQHNADQIAYSGNLYNDETGIIQAQALNLSFARDVHNAGILLGDDGLNLNVAAFFNEASGRVLSKAISITTSGVLVNNGSIVSDTALALTADSTLTNSGYLQGSTVALVAPTILNKGAADIRASGALTLTASTAFTNEGSTNAVGLTTVTAGQFKNSGSVLSDAGIKSISGLTLNQGALVSGHSLDLQANGTLTNAGTIGSYDFIKLASTVSVTNTGSILADGLLQISGPSLVNSGADALLRAKAASLLTGSVVTSGSVFLSDAFSGSFDYFQNDGIFTSGNAINLTGRDATSKLRFGARSSMLAGLKPDDTTQVLVATKGIAATFSTITFDTAKDAATQKDLVAQFAAGGNISFAGPASLVVNATLQATNGWVLLAGDSITLGAAAIINAANVRLTASNGAANNGVIAATTNLQIAEKIVGEGFGSFSNTKLIDVLTTKSFVFSGSFSNSGVFNASGSFGLVANSIANSGYMQSGGSISLNATGAMSQTGVISAVGTLGVTADSTTLAAGSYTAATAMNVTGANLTNAGQVSLTSASTSTWALSNKVVQSGMTYAEGMIKLTATNLQTTAGSLLGSTRNIYLTTTAGTSLSGSITANNIYLTAASLSSAVTSDLIATTDILLTTTAKAQHSGEIAAGRNLKITGGSLDLNGNSFGNYVELNADTTTISRGNVYALDAIKATSGGAFSTYGTFEAQNKISLTASAATTAATGAISSTSVLATLTAVFQNDGSLFAAKDADVTAASITNSATGKIEAVSLTAATLGTGAFTNAGAIDVYGFSGVVGGAFSNSGALSAKTYFGLEAGSFANSGAGNLLSDGHVYIKAAGAFTNAANRKISGDQIDIRAASVNNAGLITALNVVNIADVAGVITNSSTGKIYSKTIALIASDSLRNYGTIGAWTGTANPIADIVDLSAGSWIDSFGAVSGKTVRILAQGNIKLQDGSSLKAVELAGLKSYTAAIINYATVNAGDFTAEAGAAFDNQGSLNVTNTLSIAAGSFHNMDATLRADGTARVASITAKDMVLDLAGWVAGKVNDVSNDGSMVATGGIYIDTEKSGFTNTGTLRAPTIEVSALAGIADLGTATTAAKALIVDARSVILRGNVTASDLVSLHSRLYDVDVFGRITTKQLSIDANRNIIAGAGALRGSDLTQLVANNILRKDDASILNGKLATIAGATKDIYVQLRTGSLGTAGAVETDISGYEQANFNVSGSVALLADSGNIYLKGSVIAANDLHITSGYFTALQNATVRAGDVLHLEGNNYLKNFGGVSFDATNKVELVQNQGWFYSSDWLSGDINYNLSVVANKIVVNSDHRFINHDIWLYAKGDLVQRDHVISARGITYTAGNNITIEFDPFDWRTANLTAANTADYWNVTNAGLRGATLASQAKGTLLYAGGNIDLLSGKITSYGDLTLVASGNITSQPIYLETGRTNRPGNVGWSFSNKYQGVMSDHDASKVTIEELRPYENQIAARGNLTILAGGSATFIGSQLSSGTGDISIQAVAGRVTMIAAPGYWSYDYSKTTTKKFLFWRKTTTVSVDAYEDIYKPTDLAAANGNIYIASAAAATAAIDGTDTVFTSSGTEAYDAILSAGTTFAAQNITLTTLTTNRNILLGTYSEKSTYSSTSSTKRSLFGITYSKNTSTASSRVEFNSGNDLYADEILAITSGRDLTIVGGRLAGANVVLSAVGNLNIQAAINSNRESYFTEKTNLFTITTIQQGFERETAALPQINAGTITFSVGGDAHISGYQGATLNSQLLNIVGTHQFSNSLLGLYTASEQSSASTAGQKLNDEYYRDYVLPTAVDGSQYAYLDTLLTNYGAQYETISLRDHSWYDKQVRLTPAFQALLSAMAAYVTSGAASGLFNIAVGSPLAAGVDAALANLTSGIIGGAITGDVDLDQILRGAVLAGVSTTITSFVTSKINLGEALGASDASPFAHDLKGAYSPQAILDRLGDKVISTGIDNVIYGRDFFDGFDQLGRTFLVTETMAVVQFGIGEIGNGLDHKWEGTLPHMLLHGGLGCVVLEVMDGNCASGFFAGVSQSVLAGSSLSDEQKLKLASLVGSAAAFLFADGQAINVSFGGTVAQSGLVHNYLTHAELAEVELIRGQCLAGNNAACKRLDELQALDESRGDQLQACVGVYTMTCQLARQDVRIAAADILALSVDPNAPSIGFLGLAYRAITTRNALDYFDPKDSILPDNHGQIYDYSSPLGISIAIRAGDPQGILYGFAATSAGAAAVGEALTGGGGIAFIGAASTELRFLMNSAIKNGVNMSEFTLAQVLKLPNGSRPNPNTYLDEGYITSHLALFNGGVTKIKAGAPIGTEGPPGGTYVLPKAVADNLIRESGGDIAKLEASLGLARGDLGSNPVRVDIANPTGIRMPSGNEKGANKYWIPGGKTSGGLPEAVIDPVPPSSYTVTPIK